MAVLMQWWQGLTPRERWGLGAMIAALLVFGLYFGMMRPLERYQTRSQAAFNAAADTLREVSEGAARAQALSGLVQARQNNGGPVNLRSLASETARAQGLTISRLQPGQNGRLTVWLDQTQMPPLMIWLNDLQNAHGVTVIRAVIGPSRQGPAVDAQIELSIGAVS